MAFVKSHEVAFEEIELRKNGRDGLLKFGIDYLDDANVGICKNELIVIGSASGSGKTQLCTNIALANVANGKRVHYIALEASYLEIEQRIKFQLFANEYFSDPNRPTGIYINYRNWKFGDYQESLAKYEAAAASKFIHKTNGLNVYYKKGKFDLNDLLLTITSISSETDLVILDHLHYMDLESTNENSEIKEILKTARDLALELSIPIILVSHMRKRDKFSTELCPGQEEFHGSSDIFKVCTLAITFATGAYSDSGKVETFFRIAKGRDDSMVTKVIGKCVYLTKKGTYENGYKIGDVNQERGKEFIELDKHRYPEWSRHANRDAGSPFSNVQASTSFLAASKRAKSIEPRKDTDG
jgi:archaellum biogenesis ATPase FlaH